jgi:hypothetical protein
MMQAADSFETYIPDYTVPVANFPSGVRYEA